ncbi:thioredoxin family protein [Helicobacter pylori]|uniref:thioredoxin family protein n=1 Tax=Helicobacter pylori TaxID=210 RepID=UPI002577D3C2|nr:thioredoxin family protein [Helicobacter pylori]MDO8146569.1 thioredoxin family protein [Helicobacter pylori]WJJ01331.1 thioredoxin family protein [Helicobacter pylori]
MPEMINGKNYAEKIAYQAVVVNVGASWCPDCMKIEPIMENLAKTYQGKVEFFKVSFDESQDLKESLGIRKIPTLIFYKNGEEVGERLVEPGSSKPIEDAIKTLL